MAIDEAKRAHTDRMIAESTRNRQDRESSYREQALKIYPWICGRCTREFTRENLQQLTVHHKDHNHDNNPKEGSNWELLCLYCHDNEHSRELEADAARQALSSYDRVFWIAGGRAKAGGIDDLADLFSRVTEAFLIGEAAGPFAAALGDTPHRMLGDMAAAVSAAAEAAAATGRDEVVLLSPAAASFDQFPDFEARGEAFRAAVLALGAIPPEVAS